MTNKTGVPGTLKTFAERTGGYENFQYNTKSPQDNNPDVMLTEEGAEQMLNDANDFLQKHFPWMKDFLVIQLPDGAIRLDAADQELYFLD